MSTISKADVAELMDRRWFGSPADNVAEACALSRLPSGTVETPSGYALANAASLDQQAAYQPLQQPRQLADGFRGEHGQNAYQLC